MECTASLIFNNLIALWQPAGRITEKIVAYTKIYNKNKNKKTAQNAM